jgi:hypothetical protein
VYGNATWEFRSTLMTSWELVGKCGLKTALYEWRVTRSELRRRRRGRCTILRLRVKVDNALVATSKASHWAGGRKTRTA